MFPFLGGLASGALGLFGNMQNAAAQQQFNQQQMAASNYWNQQNQYNWDTSNMEAMNQQNLNNVMTANVNQFQENEALHGVQWRADDARNAGISPLAALGIPMASGPSANVGGGTPPGPASFSGPSGVSAPQPGTGIATLGQDLGRAMQAMQSPEDRAVAVEKTRQDLEKGDLENELLKSQIMGSSAARHSSSQLGPGLRTDPAVVKEVQVARGPDGGETSGPTRAIEGWSWMDPWTKSQWVWRNQIEPSFGYNIPKDVTPAAPGYSKYKNPVTGRFYDFPSFNDLYKRLYPGSSTYSRQSGDISP